MRAQTVIGVLLVLVGLATFLLEGIPYATQQEAVSIGPLEATVETEKAIAVPPVIGGLALAGGIVLLATGMRRDAPS